jgi:hypothetical protein
LALILGVGPTFPQGGRVINEKDLT